ncbi:protein-serine O-palmitoleoyltransferase por [Brevipalpus obovatus]|uniref:protein-serine O-palmitoleoyltransferase por n=1 Tax=Brevipalpus obovatus TaxID=246614 RepID=UPI003D9E4EAD
MNQGLQEYDPLDYDDGFDDDTVNVGFSSSIECLLAITIDAFRNIITVMLMVNIVTKLLLQFKFLQKEFFVNAIFILSGLSLVFYHFGANNLILPVHFILFVMIGLVIVNFFHNNQILWVYCLACISLNEMTIKFLNSDHIRLRVFFMSSTMKLLALHAWIQKTRDHEKSFHDSIIPRMISFLFHPSGLPFCGYSPPRLDKSPEDWAKSQFLLKSLFAFCKSILYLGLSDCVLIFLNDYLLDSIHLILIQYFPLELCHFLDTCLNCYFIALQFRCSHYFVCFLIQSSHQFWGNDLTVAKPSMIEFPRSLVDVVIAWDIPMHKWLKEHVFMPAKSRWGFLQSVMVTYMASSYIHGFRFEIWSVLLSLGIFTWIETRLRSLLASTFEACIGAKSCKYQPNFGSMTSLWKMIRMKIGLVPLDSFPKCDHDHKNTPFNSICVLISNLVFSLIAVVHLAYLGASFDLSEEASTVRYVIETWQNIGFYSHILGLVTLIIYFIIRPW